MNLQIPVFSIDGSGVDTFAIHHIDVNQDHERIGLPHRDTNFTLMFQQQGWSELMVDFREIKIQGPAIFCLLPGQVHHGINLSEVSAWVVAVDGALLDTVTRQVLTDYSVRYRPVNLQKSEAELLQKSLSLLEELQLRPLNDLFIPVQRKMLDTCIAVFVSIYTGIGTGLSGSGLRPFLITRSFLDMLFQQFRSMKSPHLYAGVLNISPSYLNEVVRNTTGFSASHWINQEVIIEAKRLLYYSDYSIKEIAFNLGYPDSAYFIRLFRKAVGEPPLRFREKIRQQYSNS